MIIFHFDKRASPVPCRLSLHCTIPPQSKESSNEETTDPLFLVPSPLLVCQEPARSFHLWSSSVWCLSTKQTFSYARPWYIESHIPQVACSELAYALKYQAAGLPVCKSWLAMIYWNMLVLKSPAANDGRFTNVGNDREISWEYFSKIHYLMCKPTVSHRMYSPPWPVSALVHDMTGLS